MVYFRVRPECDGICRFVYSESGRPVPNGEFIANELYTEKECSKFVNKSSVVEKVEINRNNTYFFIGVRFECESGVK